MITNQVKLYSLGFQIAIESLKQCVADVTWAANFSSFSGNIDSIPCGILNIPVSSNPLKPGNVRAYKLLKKHIEENNIDCIYCATPIGGLLGRLLGKNCKVKTVIYAAHGFLFFKGAGILNNTLYKLLEHLLARYTDALITITNEDYSSSLKMKVRGNKRYLIHGAGICVKDERPTPHLYLKEFGIPDDSFVLISGGFLNKNKNNKVIINALSKLKNENIFYVICGDGEQRDNLMKLCKKRKVSDKVIFAGFRKDFPNLLKSSDCFVMPSYREGVPRSLLEAMNLGLPCIGSRTRGITDLIGTNGEGGLLCNPSNAAEFANAIKTIHSDAFDRNAVSARNKLVAQDYSETVVRGELLCIFKELLC